MNALQKVFNYQDAQIRAIIKDGEPWWVARDICEALDIEDTGRAVSRLDTDESTRIEIDHPQSPNKRIEVIAVNEPGLYTLILGSRKPEAKTFKRWITHEVIPAIRKTGKYEAVPIDEVKTKRAEAMLINAQNRKANLMVKMAQTFKDVVSPESIQLLLAGATETLMGKPLLPKPTIDVHFTATEIANEIGITPNKIGRTANKHNIKTTEYGVWILDKSKHSDKQVKAFMYNEKGREKLLELLGNVN